jgi:hypothetical protein
MPLVGPVLPDGVVVVVEGGSVVVGGFVVASGEVVVRGCVVVLSVVLRGELTRVVRTSRFRLEPARTSEVT